MYNSFEIFLCHESTAFSEASSLRQLPENMQYSGYRLQIYVQAKENCNFFHLHHIYSRLD